ncbi:P-loop containing nucleoside triphosphate hydrolase protein [Mycena galericulata]|nr:P-loop containing nucleoside triphosphate hydrolase protein [Mycena galericulata]
MSRFSPRSSPSPDPDSSNSHENPSDPGVGLSDPRLSKARRQLLDLINRLHNTGVQADIDLPQIVVIGSQSAGKSSLIESIAGITLPRAAGTCTRCPTECRLRYSDGPWKCIVQLRFITDKYGQPLAQPRTEAFGDPIVVKSQVEDRIRRAQRRAILHPSKLSRNFLNDNEDDSPELSFSTNYISLEISGPELADLSFVDLPGLIASVSRGGNDRDIEMVENLVSAYISKPSTIVLLTIACETDFENQGAHHLTKKHDPEGKRTIGVLTKPDRISPGDEERWLPLIRNEEEILENNWYCVKQPSSQDLKKGTTWDDARARENEFFASTPPWSNLEPMYQKYLRTSNLVARLSSILSDLISKRLPHIQIELDNSIQQTRASLQKLPPPPSTDPVSEVAMLLLGFSGKLHTVLEGVPFPSGLIQSLRPVHEGFRCHIRRTAPDFRPFESNKKSKNQVHLVYPDPPFLKDEDGYGHWLEPFSDSVPIYIDQVLARAQGARTRELPGHFPFVVQESFISEFTSKWAEPARLLCISVHSILSDYVKALITSHFSAFGQGVLEQRVMILVQEHIRKRLECAQGSILKFIRLEKDGPFTLNEHYLSDYKAKFLSYYRSAREKDRNPRLTGAIESCLPDDGGMFDGPTPPSDIAQILSCLSSIGLDGVHAEDLVKLLPPDSMDPALNIMADVRAYFQVAYKRVADNIPAVIDHELVRGAGRDILTTLYSGLEINGADSLRICRDFAKESPAITGKREELLKRLERLETASRELVRIGF